jgi:hypothetical protein
MPLPLKPSIIPLSQPPALSAKAAIAVPAGSVRLLGRAGLPLRMQGSNTLCPQRLQETGKMNLE